MAGVAGKDLASWLLDKGMRFWARACTGGPHTCHGPGTVLGPPLLVVLPALPASGGAGDELLPEGEVTPARA